MTLYPSALAVFFAPLPSSFLSSSFKEKSHGVLLTSHHNEMAVF